MTAAYNMRLWDIEMQRPPEEHGRNWLVPYRAGAAGKLVATGIHPRYAEAGRSLLFVPEVSKWTSWRGGQPIICVTEFTSQFWAKCADGAPGAAVQCGGFSRCLPLALLYLVSTAEGYIRRTDILRRIDRALRYDPLNAGQGALEALMAIDAAAMLGAGDEAAQTIVAGMFREWGI